MTAFVRVFANDALSEILRFVNLMVLGKTFLFTLSFYIINIYISNISIFCFDFLSKLLSFSYNIFDEKDARCGVMSVFKNENCLR